MSANNVLLLCAAALLVQSISGQWLGGRAAAPFGGWGAPYGGLALSERVVGPWAAAGLAASNGPGLAVSSASPLVPAGVSVLSENFYEGTLAAGGALPFLGTVAVEGVLPTAGAGSIAYGCGNGAVAITAEEGIPCGGLPGPLGYGGYRNGLGLGFGPFY